jgi:hypothetical protein
MAWPWNFTVLFAEMWLIYIRTASNATKIATTLANKGTELNYSRHKY